MLGIRKCLRRINKNDAEEIIVANHQEVQNTNQDQVKSEYLAGALENSKVHDSEKPILIGQGIPR